MNPPALSILHLSADACGEPRRLGPYAIQSLIPEDQEGAFTAYRVRIEPGQSTAESFHRRAEEIYFVLEGAGTAVLDGTSYPLTPGDFLRLPPGTRHRFTTKDQPLVMLDIHSPGSRPDRDVYFTGDIPDGFHSDSES